MDPGQEAIWARAAREGDAAAFEQIVLRFQGPVYRLCARHLRGPEAEDAAQETFVRAFVNIKSFEPDRPLLPWLLTIARNLSLDRLRRRRPEADSETVERAENVDHTDAEQSAMNQEQMRSLEAALGELPERQREAIVMFHLEGVAYNDIAAALGVPIGTVMTWLHRGRAMLREVMTRGAPTVRREQGVSP